MKNIYPVFQPIYISRDLTVSHCEVLCRSHDGSHIELIRLAEEQGDISRIDIAMLNHAFAYLSKHKDLLLAVNVSVQTVQKASGHFLSVLYMNMELCNRLIIEVTETIRMNDMNAILRFVESARLAGAKIALDDFGAGNFTDEAIEIVRPKFVKLSAQFINQALLEVGGFHELEAIVARAATKGCLLVAEQIDTRDKFERIRSVVPYLQGFFLSRPLRQPLMPGVSADFPVAANG